MPKGHCFAFILVSLLLVAATFVEAFAIQARPLSSARMSSSNARPSGSGKRGPKGEEWAESMCRQALSGITLEYPHKVDHLWSKSDGPLISPSSLHPSFYGSYDWHSSVHSHWALVRLLRLHRDHLSDPGKVEEVLLANLAADKLQAEADYFKRLGASTFERPYGWGWALKLASECSCGADQGSELFMGLTEALAPLTGAIRNMWISYLPKLAYPVRSGVHSNTAFALRLSLDYAREVGDSELEEAIVSASKRLYEADKAYDPRFEPSGEDFLSPGVCELLLMRSVLAPEDFPEWATSFMPSLGHGSSCPLLQAPEVGDRDDARLCHLDGLLLSKCWGLKGVAAGLTSLGDGIPEAIERAADVHYADAKWKTESYSGTHWLHSFALLALTDDGR